jgi:glucose-6-phosphate isomerase
MMSFDYGLNIAPTTHPLGWTIGAGCFGPRAELRRLDDIRSALRDPNCSGPDVVYAICMDVGREEDRDDLINRHLLFGVVTYAAGTLGDEPVRSQGHVHKPSPRNGWLTPEVYEIWSGRAVILMQETDRDDPGRCFAVEATPGQVVIVPPGWAHAAISADPTRPLTFGAWCDRAYGFDYTQVRARRGLAWYPIVGADNRLSWQPNPAYTNRLLTKKPPREYRELGIERGVSVYEQYRRRSDLFDFVPNPQQTAELWIDFVP